MSNDPSSQNMPAPQVDEFKDIQNDPGFLVAKGRFPGNSVEKMNQEKKHQKKLANAVFKSIINNGYANLRAVGSFAIANAVRAITLASIKSAKKGVVLYWDSVFEHGNLGPLRDSDHVKNVTAILFRLRFFKDLGGNENE